MSDQDYEVIANVSPRSIGRNSLFDTDIKIHAGNVEEFSSTPDDVRDARRALRDAGFHIFEQASNDKTLSIGADAKLFRSFFGAKLTKQKAEVGPETEVTFMGTDDSDPEASLLMAPEALGPLIEGAVIARPPTYFAPSAIPPVAEVHSAAYQYLTVPDGIAVMLRASRVHRLGVTGKNVIVGMLDTGFYRHPFFTERGYRSYTTLLGPGATDPSVDANGHGTGESANIFACAPDVTLLPVKTGNDPVGAINMALANSNKPHVLTNSWGYHIDLPGTSIPNWLKPLEAAVANAVAQGVVVCFSAGNGHLAFPGSHPDVISVGGVHVNLPDTLDFEASSYASSFDSSFYPGRSVPDVCGLTGKRVTISGSGYAPSILLPVQEGGPRHPCCGNSRWQRKTGGPM